MDEKIQVSCEMEVTLKVIGGKYKLLILHYLMDEGTKRYSEILRFLGNVHKRTLTTQLRELEEDRIIFRKICPSVPPQVEYGMTELGETLRPIIEMMCEWGYENLRDRYELTNRYCSEEEE